MARFVVVSAVMVFFFGASCGAPSRPDAGTAVGGGLSGAGAGTGGGSAGGAGGGMGTAGGAAGGMAAGDGGLNCIQVAAINWTTGGPGSATIENPNDGGTIVVSTGVVTGPGAQGPFLTAEALLFNETPATPLMLPITGTFETIGQASTVYPAAFMGLNCQMNGSMCQQLYIGARGTYTITAAGVGASGTFNGTFTNVRLARIDPMTFRPIVDGGCVDLASFNFQTSW